MKDVRKLPAFPITFISTDLFEYIITILYSLYSVITVLSVTEINKIHGILSILVHMNYLILGCLLLMPLFMQRIEHRMLYGIFGLLMLCALIILRNGKILDTMEITLFLIYGSRINSKLLFRTYAFITFAIVFMTVSFSFLGIYSNSSSYVYGRGWRSNLGFNYTTYAPNFLFHVALAYYYVKEKITVPSTLMMMLFNIVLMHYTNTRAVFYELTLFLFVMWIYRAFPKLFKTRLFGIGSALSMPLLAGLMFFLTVTYSPRYKISRMLDSIFTGRLHLGHQAIEKYGYPLFGTRIEWVTNTTSYNGEYFYVDSSYINAMLTFGVVLTAFVIISFSVLSYRAYLGGDPCLCIVIVFLAIHSFSDPQLMELRYVPFLLLLMKGWYAPTDKIALKPGKLLRSEKIRIAW